MKFYSVFDPEFKAYGQVVTGMDDTLAQILKAMKALPVPEAVGYVPEEPILQSLPAMQEVSDHLYGGMPVELGWCCGHNTKLNCLEYHRDSEFNLAAEDAIVLLARQDEIEEGKLDSAKVKAFRVPAGTMVEFFATTLHFAPCHADPAKGFKMMVALPMGTNTDRPAMADKSPEDKLLWARNKWLIAHPEAPEAAQGAYVGITGENIDIAPYI